jgi:hypothetical protein
MLSVCRGSDAGCSRGNNTSRHAMLPLQIAATLEVQVRCVLIFPPDSINASSNIAHLASAYIA